VAAACGRYSKRTLRIAYEVIEILADRTGSAFVGHRGLIMPTLHRLYERIPDDDPEIQPLFNCLSGLAVSLGIHFEEYALPIYCRCLGMVKNLLETQRVGQIAANWDNFVASALDLLGGMFEGLGSKMEHFVGQSGLAEVLYYCCQMSEVEIRQSAFALLGEVAKTCPSSLASNLSEFAAVSVDNFSHQCLTENGLSVCNNACWALGELSLLSGPDQFRLIATKVLENTVNIMVHARCLPRNLVENATITLGRVVLICSTGFAQHLHVYVGVWCQMLRSIRDNLEKEQSFKGLFVLVNLRVQQRIHFRISAKL